MTERVERKPKFSELDLQGKVDYIMRERTPSPEEVIYEPTIEFLDPEGELTREERGKVIALGDRTAISYKNLKQRVLDERGKPPVELEGQKVDRTASFYLQYSLGAGSSKEIAHTSILEQVNVGKEEFGGDAPIIIEGVSILPSLRDICALRHFGFEAFSSRGGIFPEEYWRVPRQLVEAGVGEELAAINKDIYEIYIQLTRGGIEYYLQVAKKGKDEKFWQWRWRVLNLALDEARQVTNGTFLNHFSMHPNSALSLREALVKLSSSGLPETKEIAEKLRELAQSGLPTLMRYTEASPYTESLPQKRRDLLSGLKGKRLEGDTSRLISAEITADADRVFLAAFLAKGKDISFPEAFAKLKEVDNRKIEEAIDKVFEDFGLHDKPPEELEMIQITANHAMSLGAIYQAIRHRLTTKILSRLTPRHGFTTPEVYKELELDSLYAAGMTLNENAYSIVKDLGPAYDVFADYFVARGHIIPFTMRISAMDVFHYLKIRAAKSAHPDISAPSRELADFLVRVQPSIFNQLVQKG